VMLKKSNWQNTGGHDNRVFAVKFIDDKTLISGGLGWCYSCMGSEIGEKYQKD
jgi:hypothetical protein